ncbi:MAG: hypothetical protein SGJ17_05845 [Hyphomicrobiales bacterium]|nr:hypothetical protein [Hyphomicrobiales bacterium]
MTPHRCRALRPAFNLTVTVIHTNLGRSLVAEQAIAAASAVMRWPAALEMDLDTGKRGERDDIVRDLICKLTGAVARRSLVGSTPTLFRHIRRSA